MNFSYSKATMFEECPRKYMYEYVLHLSELVKSDAMAIGEGLHKFLEEKAKNSELGVKECEDIYIEAATKARCMVSEKAIQDHKFLVQKYFEHNKFITPKIINGKPAVEVYFKLNCGDGAIVNGKIDIISVRGAVVDYKTASKPYDIGTMLNPVYDKGIQITTYSAAVLQDYGVLPEVNGYQVILKDGSQVQNLATVPTMQHVEAVKKYYRAQYAKMMNLWDKFANTVLWPRGVNPKCFWCSYRIRCSQKKLGG
jgi:ATP-dependent helicase/DNAse subunit B